MKLIGKVGYLALLVIASSVTVDVSTAEAGLFSHLFGGSCCEPEPVCCEPEPVCCEPEPVCCEPEPAPEPVCCEPEPEPEPVCCEPEPEPCCASAVPLPTLGEGEVLLSISPIRYDSTTSVSASNVAARPVVTRQLAPRPTAAQRRSVDARATVLVRWQRATGQY